MLLLVPLPPWTEDITTMMMSVHIAPSLTPYRALGWPHRAFTFRALSKTYGQMWLRCDICRRYARLKLAGLHEVDYRTKAFSCSVFRGLLLPGRADQGVRNARLPSG
jgi:hypothetical protein